MGLITKILVSWMLNCGFEKAANIRCGPSLYVCKMNQSLLLVEDNEHDVFLMKRALKQAEIQNPLYVVGDWEQAIDYLSGNGEFSDRESYPFPALVFLDLKLPLKSGHDVLAWIRHEAGMSELVVVVLTSSDEPSDINRAYKLRANSYLVKPPSLVQLRDLVKSFKWYWLQYNHFAECEAKGCC
jgi:CheY-like chemotaxis protein